MKGGTGASETVKTDCGGRKAVLGGTCGVCVWHSAPKASALLAQAHERTRERAYMMKETPKKFRVNPDYSWCLSSPRLILGMLSTRPPTSTPMRPRSTRRGPAAMLSDFSAKMTSSTHSRERKVTITQARLPPNASLTTPTMMPPETRARDWSAVGGAQLVPAVRASHWKTRVSRYVSPLICFYCSIRVNHLWHKLVTCRK